LEVFSHIATWRKCILYRARKVSLYIQRAATEKMSGVAKAFGRQRGVFLTDIGGEQDTCFGEAAPLLGRFLVEQHGINSILHGRRKVVAHS
jgi:hypothetical protein